MAASSESGSGVAACTSAIVTPPATKRGARTAIRRHSAGTRSRHNRAPIAIIRPATRSTGASGGATVPTAIPAATRIAHKSSLTGGLRSRSGLDRFACLDSGKGCYLLQGLGPDSRNLFERIRAIVHTRSQGSCNRVPVWCRRHLQSEHPINFVTLLAGETVERIWRRLGHLLDKSVSVLFELLYALLVVL